MNTSITTARNQLLMPSVFENFLDDFSPHPRRADNGPWLPVDIRESDKEFLFVADIPGVSKNELSVNYEDGVLTIEAKFGNKVDTKDNNGKYLRSERFSGSCERHFRLPSDIVQESIDAKLADGVLTVKVQKPDLEKKKAATRVKIG